MPLPLVLSPSSAPGLTASLLTEHLSGHRGETVMESLAIRPAGEKDTPPVPLGCGLGKVVTVRGGGRRADTPAGYNNQGMGRHCFAVWTLAGGSGEAGIPQALQRVGVGRRAQS